MHIDICMIETNLFDYNSIDEAVAVYSPTVYRLAYVYTGNVADAEDIMQEVFVRFVKRKPVFESNVHQKAWFLRATINCCKTLLMSKWKKSTTLVDSFNEESQTEQMADNSILDAVAKLNENQRLVVHLFYYEDMSIKAIARTLGMLESTVKSHLNRAKKNLKNILEEDENV